MRHEAYELHVLFGVLLALTATVLLYEPLRLIPRADDILQATHDILHTFHQGYLFPEITCRYYFRRIRMVR